MDKDNTPDIYADVPVFDRYTHIMVDADVEIMFHHGKPKPTKIRIKDIPCLWVWDETSREAANRLSDLRSILA